WVRHAAVHRRLVLVEEILRRPDELLPDRLIVIVREHRDRPEDADAAPGDRERRAHDLRAVLLGDEAAPRLHEPAMMDVLRAAEGLARSRAQLPLEEIAEGLLHDVADLGEIALPHPSDLNLGKPALRVEPGALGQGHRLAESRQFDRDDDLVRELGESARTERS